MKYYTKLNKLYHRLIFLNYHRDVPSEMKFFLKLNPLDQKIMNITFEENGISISNLTKILSIPKSTMTSAIKRLENMELIKRNQSEIDKRVNLITLTHQGLDIQNSHQLFEKNLFANILLSLDDEDERRFFLDALEKIVQRLETLSDFNNMEETI